MRKSCACNRQEIINKMRKLWSQHVYWTRFFIISTAEELPDLKYVTNRLLENPGDFAKVFKIFFCEQKANEFKKLLTEHLQIAGDLVNADKDGNTAKADELRKKWYENADDMADVGANAMFANATVKGTIDTIPEVPGLAVWVDGHIGIYIGNGEVIEA